MSLKRVVLRFEQIYTGLDEVDIVKKFFQSIKSDVPDVYVHLHIPESKRFYLVLDINASQEINPNLQEIPHEVYKVTLYDNNEP